MPLDTSQRRPQRIAIIGGGISGLASAWLLSRHHEVTLYEAETRLGGHARTVTAGLKGDQPVDTGFIVFNKVNYPHLTAMFEALEVPIEPSDMSFGVSIGGGRLEYALRTPRALFGQRRNLVRPGFYGMLADILRFNSRAEAAVRPGQSIAGLVDKLGLGRGFRDDYLYPICSAIWSTSQDRIGEFPSESMIRFMRNHALLSSSGQHQWWTVSGGSISYVSRLEVALRVRGVDIRTGSPVTSVSRDGPFVTVTARGHLPQPYDQVVLAGHADTTLRMLSDADADERAALSAVRFQDNHAILHRDTAFMPRRRACWSSWVYRTEAGAAENLPVGVTYWMNRLQNIPEADPLFVTLNPAAPPPDHLIYDQITFRHPVFNAAALEAQTRLDALQGRNRTWFAGAWMRNGFHEDGFASAVSVAGRLAPVIA